MRTRTRVRRQILSWFRLKRTNKRKIRIRKTREVKPLKSKSRDSTRSLSKLRSFHLSQGLSADWTILLLQMISCPALNQCAPSITCCSRSPPSLKSILSLLLETVPSPNGLFTSGSLKLLGSNLLTSKSQIVMRQSRSSFPMLDWYPNKKRLRGFSIVSLVSTDSKVWSSVWSVWTWEYSSLNRHL